MTTKPARTIIRVLPRFCENNSIFSATVKKSPSSTQLYYGNIARNLFSCFFSFAFWEEKTSNNPNLTKLALKKKKGKRKSAE